MSANNALARDVAPSAETVLEQMEKRARAMDGELAARTDAGEDVLDYLAQNGAPATRRAVAANPSAAPRTNRRLADDPDEEVRVRLARKIGVLLPGLVAMENEHLRALTVATLERLARDLMPRVRAVLAEAIKTSDCVPHNVALALAKDAEVIVAAPIVEFSPILTDTDLLEIIASAQAREIVAAVARRSALSHSVSDAVERTLDVPATAALLANTEAQIRKRTLDRIVKRAADNPDLQRPLVMRADLPQRLIRRIAGFLGASLIETLAKRHDLDRKTRAFIENELARRLKSDDLAQSVRHVPAASETEAALGTDKIDDAFVNAAADEGQRDSVIFALANLARVRPDTVTRIIRSGSARALTALVWRAKLKMRTAFKIQTRIMKLAGAALLPARDGEFFPMNEDEMLWHLAYFDIRD